jgi:preprotein translocase subunit SecA
LDEAALRGRCESLKESWRRERREPGLVIESLAVVREQSRRVLGLEPFEEQVAGSAALMEGCVVEMATGEGKTLVAAVAAVVEGWRGRGCHVVTVNDYLVQRDAAWMRPLYRACVVSSGFIVEQSDAEARRGAYGADVTYATNKELAADFLRDQIARRRRGGALRPLFDAAGERAGADTVGIVQRGLEFGIVDEADSILIDEAVTPLIISEAHGFDEACAAARVAEGLARPLVEHADYRVDRRFHEVRLTRAGRARVLAGARSFGGVWAGSRRAEELVTLALSARELHRRDAQYVVADGRVVIVDEFTGRLMPDRTWRGGLQQAVEAKEGLEIRPMADTAARVSFQTYFRAYRRLSGMTGTAREARHELWSAFRLPVVEIPTHCPVRREVWPARIHRDAEARWDAVVAEIEEVHATGRPVLIGMRTVAASEGLSERLRARGVGHTVLNAVHHEREAAIIARAGEASAVTIATNMAGRGTDIRLGAGVAEAGGLHVIVTEPHESRRIDRQFLGRGARQGDPGSGRLHASLDDELVALHAPWARGVGRRWRWPAWVGRALFRIAESRAQALGRRRRAAVIRADEWLERGLAFAAR